MADKALDQERHRPAGVGKNPADVAKFLRVATEDDIGDGARGVGAELDHDRRLGLDQIDAAIGRGRMGIDDGLAPVELFHHRQKRGIAEPFVAVARHQADTVGLQRIERIGDLLQAAVGIGQRNHRKTSEPAGMIRRELRRVIVALARQFSCGLAGGEIERRRGHREDRGCHARFVHIR